MNFKKIKKYFPDKIAPATLHKISKTAGFVLFVIIAILIFEIYIPANPFSKQTVVYAVQKGSGDEEIADNLQKLGLIRSSYFFQLYEIITFRHAYLQAGKYNFSPRMSVYEIVKKLSNGDVVKNKITILEGWDAEDVASYMEQKGLCKKDEFLQLVKQDYSATLDFLKDKPKKSGLEGYIFPDTYEIAEGDTCQDVLQIMLANFGKKLTPQLREEIAKQEKSIFDIVTMASLIEKEVKNIDDKKIVSGILWRRIAISMPLQLDCTINYITGKSDPGAAIKDTKIDSPYNTYMYYGLPKGPISNPGINSILAAIYPTKTDYLYYLSDGKTYYSKTFEEHQAKKAQYLD